MEKLSLIGLGRFGKTFKKNFEKVFKGEKIYYIYDKNFKRELDKEKLFDSDIIVISVNDDSILDVLKNIKDYEKEVIIVSASFEIKEAKKILKKASNISIFHPIQSFTYSDDADIFKNIYATVQSLKKSKFLEKFSKLNQIKVIELKNVDRKKYHLSSMLALNYTLTLLYLSEKLLKESTSKNFSKSPFLSVLKKLLEKVERESIKEVITGPSKRGDLKLIKKISENLYDRDLKKLFLLLDKITRERLK